MTSVRGLWRDQHLALAGAALEALEHLGRVRQRDRVGDQQPRLDRAGGERVERGLGGKADIVFECVGIPGLIDQAVQQVRNRGTVLLLGLCTRPDPINSFAMLSKEVKLVTSAFFTVPEYQASLDALAAGAIEPRLLVTDTISLEAVPEVFESLKRRTHQCKVLIAPQP